MKQQKGLHVVHFEEQTFESLSDGQLNSYSLVEDYQEIEKAYDQDDAFSQLPYCVSILDKITSLSTTEFGAFLDHQMQLLNHPKIWLDQLALLLDLNLSHVNQWGIEEGLSFYQSVIQEKKAHLNLEIRTLLNETVYKWYQTTYSIDRLKEQLKHLDTLQEKHVFLLEKKFEYLQNKPPFIIEKVVPFDKQLDLEIERIKQLKKVRKKETSKPLPVPSSPIDKFRTDLSVPELAYLFKILTEEGLLQVGNKTDLFKQIATHFASKQSQAISWKSLKNNFDVPPLRAIESWSTRFRKMYQIAKEDSGI